MINYYIYESSNDDPFGAYKKVTYYVFYAFLRSLKKSGSNYVIENRYFSDRQEKRLKPPFNSTCGTWK